MGKGECDYGLTIKIVISSANCGDVTSARWLNLQPVPRELSRCVRNAEQL